MRPKGSRELRGVIKASEVKLLKLALLSASLAPGECNCSDSAQKEMTPYLNSWVALYPPRSEGENDAWLNRGKIIGLGTIRDSFNAAWDFMSRFWQHWSVTVHVKYYCRPVRVRDHQHPMLGQQ